MIYEGEPGSWIRELPRVKASSGFTREVMRRTGTRRPRRPIVWRMAAAVATAACLALVLQAAILHHSERQRLETLRAEQQRIETELAQVKRIADQVEPVVVLENDDGTRVVMDVDSAIQPASLRTWD